MSEDSSHLTAFGGFLVELKESDGTFNNYQPINHVSILVRIPLFRVIAFIPWSIFKYVKCKLLENIGTDRTHYVIQ